jgi:hypothetical protein
VHRRFMVFSVLSAFFGCISCGLWVVAQMEAVIV